MLSVSVVLPVIGKWYDAGIAERTPTGPAPSPEVFAGIQAAAGLEALGKVALLPAVLSVIFVVIAVLRRKPTEAPVHQSS
jgi:hypothetical protein